VWYDYVSQKWSIFNQDKDDMLADASFNVLVATKMPNSFIHTATDANISGHVSCIDHPYANSNPLALLLVTQNWNPGGVGGSYNDHYIGVWYKLAEKKWCIYNEDTSTISEGSAFNILVIGSKLLLPTVMR
jgi:hypothetical protein